MQLIIYKNDQFRVFCNLELKSPSQSEDNVDGRGHNALPTPCGQQVSWEQVHKNRTWNKLPLLKACKRRKTSSLRMAHAASGPVTRKQLRIPLPVLDKQF